jgi:hypothetical protein
MNDVVMTVTIFHTLAAVAAFSFMVFSAVKLVQNGGVQD